MRSPIIIILFLWCLSANAQEITSEWIIESFIISTGDQLPDNYYHTDYHLMINGKMQAETKSQLTSIKKISNIVGLEPVVEIKEKTITPSGHIMIIATIKHEDRLFSLLSAIRKTKDQLRKEFDFFQEITTTDESESMAINMMRDLWQQHSNAHRPDLVVSEVYSPDAYYLNRGKLLNNNDAIRKEYGYMANASWGIVLVEEGSLRVSDHCTIEIGTYADGRGQYLLIWKSDPAGNWKIQLDFNF
jgi:hypothetical protein